MASGDKVEIWAVAIWKRKYNNKEIYLMILNKELYKEKRKTNKVYIIINATYITFSFIC
jgi:hypothetical protein